MSLHYYSCALGQNISTFVLGHAFQKVCMDSYGCVYASLVLASLEEIRLMKSKEKKPHGNDLFVNYLIT